MMRIALVRHAAVAFPAGRWVWPDAVPEEVARYNQAPIIPSAVPRELQGLVQSASVILASSLARSVHTAELLARGREIIVDPVFDEAGLPSPRGQFPLLPVRVWFVVLRILWWLGWAGGSEPKAQAQRRARAAAERMVRIPQADGPVVLVGHGIFMALLSRALEDMGWRRRGPLPRQPWSACFLDLERGPD